MMTPPIPTPSLTAAELGTPANEHGEPVGFFEGPWAVRDWQVGGELVQSVGQGVSPAKFDSFFLKQTANGYQPVGIQLLPQHGIGEVGEDEGEVSPDLRDLILNLAEGETVKLLQRDQDGFLEVLDLRVVGKRRVHRRILREELTGASAK